MIDDKVQELTVDAKLKAHSDAEFMDEIDQQMAEVKKGTSKTSSPSKKVKQEKQVEQVSQETQETQETQVTQEEKTPAEDKGEIIQVKKIPKIIVSKSEPAKTAPPDSSAGKPLQPIDLGIQGEQGTEEKQVEQGIQESSEEIESIPVRVKKYVTDDDMTSDTNDANWLDSIPTPEESGKVGQGAQEKEREEQVGQVTQVEQEEKEEDSMQTLKTFDATKYHIPIKEGQHPRRHSVSPWVAVLSLGLLVVLVIIAAVDMGVLDIGIDLPFDIL